MSTYYIKITPANVPLLDDDKRIDYLGRCCKHVIDSCSQEQLFGVFKYLFNNDSGRPFSFAVVAFEPRLASDKNRTNPDICITDEQAKARALGYLREPNELPLNASYIDLEGMIRNSDLFSH